MIITFFGNSKLYHDKEDIYNKIIKCFNQFASQDTYCIFYCGCKGEFDLLSEKAIDEVKCSFPTVQKIFISPYFTINYQTKHLNLLIKNFDEIIFPDILTNCISRFAYTYRNKWMVDNADIIISYLVVGGGAEKTISYAKKKNKRIIDLLEILDF